MMKTERGVTLLELLVAITLLGLISLGLVSALRVGSSAWQRGNTRLAANRRVVAAADLLSTQLANAQARWVRWGAQGQEQQRFAYFDGAPDRLRFLTSYSLETRNRGGLRLAEYFFRRDESDTCSLYYNERPFYDDRDVAWTVQAAGFDITRGRQRVVFAPAARNAGTRELYHNLRQCHFEYLVEPPQGEPYWGAEWETSANLLPRAVAARFLAKDAAGLTPVGTVATLHTWEVAPPGSMSALVGWEVPQ